jgi:vacuolar-type H+-ATPase subunit E/Vma4
MTLETARDALLADARATANDARAEAQAAAAGRLDAARREADAIVARAREQGDAEGRERGALEEGVARTLARMEVLAARREAYEELRRQARAAVLRLRDDPGYPQLLDRLAAAARRDLGDDALLERDPGDAGGVRASRGSRRVDHTLVALADRCVDDLGVALQRLWT